MRLLNSFNLQFRDFPADQIPPYAILSHTWGEDEVLFADIERGNAESKAGFVKIRSSCEQAAANGLDFIWIDTCCIDKSSSAELLEAINSMYSWYKKAKICYAYLADVPTIANIQILNSALAHSRWFKRGWTLQELIAPSDLTFFSCEWIEVGTKSTLHDVLARITGIDPGILAGAMELESTSIAKRMSWAAHRVTTRIEDIAYCMMGLFDVNMPLLYGEGEKAFLRLQEEIMKYSDDHSLFAWTDPTAPANTHCGLLAKSPADFVNSSNIMPYRDRGPSAPFSMSNKGLHINLSPPDYEELLGIYLKCVSSEDHQYARVKPQALCKITKQGRNQTVYVRQSPLNYWPQDIYSLHAFQLRKGFRDGYVLIKTVSFSDIGSPIPIPPPKDARHWIPVMSPSTFKISKRNNELAGALLVECIDGERLVILLGSATDFSIGFDVAPMSSFEKVEKLKRSFNPHAPGTDLILENHQVHVDAVPRIYKEVKFYMVEVNIVVQATHRAPNRTNKIAEIKPRSQCQSDERANNEIVSFSRHFGKFKLPFKSSRGDPTPIPTP